MSAGGGIDLRRSAANGLGSLRTVYDDGLGFEGDELFDYASRLPSPEPLDDNYDPREFEPLDAPPLSFAVSPSVDGSPPGLRLTPPDAAGDPVSLERLAGDRDVLVHERAEAFERREAGFETPDDDGHDDDGDSDGHDDDDEGVAPDADAKEAAANRDPSFTSPSSAGATSTPVVLSPLPPLPPTPRRGARGVGTGTKDRKLTLVSGQDPSSDYHTGSASSGGSSPASQLGHMRPSRTIVTTRTVLLAVLLEDGSQCASYDPRARFRHGEARAAERIARCLPKPGMLPQAARGGLAMIKHRFTERVKALAAKVDAITPPGSDVDDAASVASAEDYPVEVGRPILASPEVMSPDARLALLPWTGSHEATSPRTRSPVLMLDSSPSRRHTPAASRVLFGSDAASSSPRPFTPFEIDPDEFEPSPCDVLVESTRRLCGARHQAHAPGAHPVSTGTGTWCSSRAPHTACPLTASSRPRAAPSWPLHSRDSWIWPQRRCVHRAALPRWWRSLMRPTPPQAVDVSQSEPFGSITVSFAADAAQVARA